MNSRNSGAEAMAERFELRPNLSEVVDLAVEDDPDCPVLVGQRLIAGGEIDDAETPMAEADAGADEEAVGVRSPVRDDRCHRCQTLAIDRPCRVEIEFAGDAAHLRMPPVGVVQRRRRRVG